MSKANHCWIWIFIFATLAGCGPDTIFLRPGLDTPSQHVSNGYRFLDQRKLHDAWREFDRARELAPEYTEAYVGLGIVYGYQGDIDSGLQTLDKAKAMAINREEHECVDRGFDQLHQLMRDKGISPRQR